MFRSIFRNEAMAAYAKASDLLKRGQHGMAGAWRTKARMLRDMALRVKGKNWWMKN